MNTKRILMIIGAALMIAGFAIIVISNRMLHSDTDTLRNIGACLLVAGTVSWIFSKTKP